jgi:hypothetical protein
MNFLALLVRQNLIFLLLSLDSINKRFHKIDQCFRYASISYLSPAVANAFIDSKDKIPKINQVLYFEESSIISINSVQYFFDIML